MTKEQRLNELRTKRLKGTSDEMWSLVETVYLKGYDDGFLDGGEAISKVFEKATDLLTQKEHVPTKPISSNKTH